MKVAKYDFFALKGQCVPAQGKRSDALGKESRKSQAAPQGQWFLRKTLPFQGEKDLCGVRGSRASLRFALG